MADSICGTNQERFLSHHCSSAGRVARGTGQARVAEAQADACGERHRQARVALSLCIVVDKLADSDTKILIFLHKDPLILTLRSSLKRASQREERERTFVTALGRTFVTGLGHKTSV